MRETCARALAAALMTGAIATAVGLPSAFESTSAPDRGLTAPPSSLQRTVRIPAGTAREGAHRAERGVVAQHASRPSVVSRARSVRHVIVRPAAQRPHTAPSRGPAPTPAPAPAPTPSPADAAVAAPPPATTDTTRELTSTPEPPPVVEPSAPPPPRVTEEPEPEKDKDKGKDKEKDKKDKDDHGKGRGHGKED